MNREAHISIGGTGTALPYASLVGVTSFYSQMNVHWYTRRPIPLSSFDNLFKVFPTNVWLYLIGTLLVFSTLFSGTYYIYGSEPFKIHELKAPLTTRLDFILLTFTTFLEPDPLPWFPKLSAGE